MKKRHEEAVVLGPKFVPNTELIRETLAKYDQPRPGPSLADFEEKLRKEERDCIVKWLRHAADTVEEEWGVQGWERASTARAAAEQIERGRHREWASEQTGEDK